MERDRRDALRRLYELPGGAFQPEPPCKLQRRLTGHASKDAVKVERRQAGTAREALERDRPIEPVDDAFDGVLHRFQIERVCRCLHGDRKSTRLNSSHVKSSYAVFCLKKKNTT